MLFRPARNPGTLPRFRLGGPPRAYTHSPLSCSPAHMVAGCDASPISMILFAFERQIFACHLNSAEPPPNLSGASKRAKVAVARKLEVILHQARIYDATYR